MQHNYIGNELELFANARNWKAYWGGSIRPYVKGRVLDVGAGIGSNIPVLHNQRLASWLALEPDRQLADQIQSRIAKGELPAICEVQSSTIRDLDRSRLFDTILYVDVLEHIEDDRGELERAAERLDFDGALIVLSPAHQRLFSAFDKAIGHFRRYNATSLRSVAPRCLELERMFYLDSVGIVASLGNKMLLHSPQPTDGQIELWDKLIVPLSRIMDPLTGYTLGKTIIGVWRRPRVSGR